MKVSKVQLGSGTDGPSFSLGVAALELLGDDEEEDEDSRLKELKQLSNRRMPMIKTRTRKGRTATATGSTRRCETLQKPRASAPLEPPPAPRSMKLCWS